MGSTVISASIDGTIRQWSLRPDELQQAVEMVKKGPALLDEDKPNTESMLTEEEERELAELMED